MGDGGGATHEMGMGLFMEPGGLIYLCGSKGTDNIDNFTVGGIKINDGEFHHIAATWTGNTTVNEVVLYIDGSRAAFGTAKEAIVKGSTPLYIGRHNTLGYYPFTGIIDEVRVFSRALNPNEIKKLSHK